MINFIFLIICFILTSIVLLSIRELRTFENLMLIKARLSNTSIIINFVCITIIGMMLILSSSLNVNIYYPLIGITIPVAIFIFKTLIENPNYIFILLSIIIPIIVWYYFGFIYAILSLAILVLLIIYIYRKDN